MASTKRNDLPTSPPPVEMEQSLMKFVRLAAAVAGLLIILLYTYRHHIYMWMNVGGMTQVPVYIWVTGFVRYMIWPWIVMFLIAAAGFSIGHAIMRKMGNVTMQGVSVLYSTALGLGILAAAAWVLGWAHLLYSPILVVIVIGSIVLGFRAFIELEKNIRPFWVGWDWWDLALLILIGLFVARTIFLAADPSIGFDATSGHLYQAKLYLEDHVIRYNPLFSFIVLAHMLTVIQMAMGIADPGSVLPYFAMLMASFGIFFIGDRYFGRTAGLVAVLIYMLLPMSYICDMQWFAEHILIMYTVLMLLAVLTWWDTVTYGKDKRNQRSDMRWLVIAGLMGGFAASTKIYGLIPAAILVLLTGRQWWRTLIWVIIGLSPWYLVNAIHFGNPLFPHYEQWFGWMKFGIQEATTQNQSEAQSLPNGFYPWSDPWNLTFSINAPWAKKGEMSEIGPFLLAFSIPLLLIPWKKWTPAAIKIGIFVLVAYLYWFLIEKYFSPRYMLYVFAIHGIIAAYGFTLVIRNYKKVFIPILILLLAIFGYAVTMKYANPTCWYVPIQREVYLNKNFPAMQIFKHINENEPDIRLFQVGFKNYRFWADFDMIGDQNVRAYGERYRQFNQSAEQLYNWLKSLNRTHILVNEDVREMWFNQTYELPKSDPEFYFYFQPAIELEDWTVYRLTDDPERERQEAMLRAQQEALEQSDEIEEIVEGDAVLREEGSGESPVGQGREISSGESGEPTEPPS
jgi:hypothetical protein